jgi:MOSC domain-containing protein YiiM
MAQLRGIAFKRSARAPVELCESSSISLEGGVANDFRGKTSKRRQVTLLRSEDWAAACDEIGHALPWTTRRANLLVEGLPSVVDRNGAHICIGDVRLLITGETEPCEQMEAAAAGLRAALTPGWRGGVTCRVISGGAISTAQDVTLSLQP